MYTITCIDRDGTETPVFLHPQEGMEVVEATIEENLNKTGELSVIMPQSNRNYDALKKLETEVVIRDTKSEEEIFRGRCISEDLDFYNTRTSTCEGTMGYLNDTKHAPYLWQGNVRGFLEELLEAHNAKATDRQKIYLGQVTVEDPNNYFRRESQDYDYTLKIILDKIVDTYSGLLRIRRTNGKNYLDYLADYPVSDQIIQFGENMIDLTKYVKAEDVKTVIIPLGAEIDKETGQRVKIASVNGGKDYLIDQALVEKYGWIEETVIFDDVTMPENLKDRGEKYLEECRNMSLTIEITAIDGRVLGLDVHRIKPGMLVRVVSGPHGINSEFLCTSKTTNLLNPDQDKVILGNQFTTYTESVDKIQKEYEETIKKNKTVMMEIIKQTQEDFKKALESAKGLYHTTIKDEAGAEIHYLHDKKELKDSDIRIVINTAGIGLTADGGQHWYGFQVDGNMIANILTAIGINAAWIRTGLITDALGKSVWNLDNGDMSICGDFAQYDSAGHKRIEIKNYAVTFYDFAGKEIEVGKIQPVALAMPDGTYRWSLNIMCPIGGRIAIGEAAGSYAFIFDAAAEHPVTVGHDTLFEGKVKINGFLDLGAKTVTAGKGIFTEIDVRDGEIKHIKDSKTGKAIFSDGSYLSFTGGILTGGKTASGTTF